MLQIDADILAMPVVAFAWTDSFQARQLGAQIAPERLDGAVLLASIRFAPLEPAMNSDSTSISKAGPTLHCSRMNAPTGEPSASTRRVPPARSPAGRNARACAASENPGAPH